MSDMKCPVCSWCNQPMVLQDDIFVCANTDCSACAEPFLHKALAQAKQDLEQLEKCCSVWKTQALDYRNALKDIVFCKQFDSVIAVRKYADKVLEQIEYKDVK